MTTKRIQWIDNLKYICIICVIISHLQTNTDILYTAYAPFFLNGFYFAAGLVYNHSLPFLAFLSKKIKGLFIPWLVFSVFNIILSNFISTNEHTSLLVELKWNFLQIRGVGDSVWFVAALFVAFIPFYFFINLYEQHEKRPFISVIFLLISFLLSLISNIYIYYMDPLLLPWKKVGLPWHIEYIFIAMFWMFLGYLYKSFFIKNDCSITNKPLFLHTTILYLTLRYIVLFINYDVRYTIIQFPYDYISSFLGLLCLIQICQRIPQKKYITYLGQNTLICFALHGKIYAVIEYLLSNYFTYFYSIVLTNSVLSSIVALIIAIFVSIILIIPIYIINTYFPYIIGRKSSSYFCKNT